MKYNHKKIEAKWQKKWEAGKAFNVKENSKKKKFYCLDMFPYPSGEGLHMGHAFVYSLGDIYARFKRLQGFNVLYPIGYDSLGLPAENAAIKAGTHPSVYTKKSIANFKKQQKAMGWSYDWAREIKTSDSDFYKWDQWIFLKMLEKEIAYRKKAPVNWCEKCQTVLANEQVVNGKCWRHSETDVQIKHLEQWFFKITNYAEELLEGLEKLDWPRRAKLMQKNWIGKSYGTEIFFDVNGKKWPVFTTRPDTIYGVTFMVVSAQHLKLMKIVTESQKKEVEKFLKKLKSVSEKELENIGKEGVFTGSYAINPLTKEKVPIWAGNFVIADYGSGMVMAVPAHDQRDYEFAKKYKLKIKEVVSGGNVKENAFIGDGELVSSGRFTGLKSKKAADKIAEYLGMEKIGKKVVQFKLRDWLISRQRYWGTPIPVVYCNRCGVVPVPGKELPIKLPERAKFGKGNPLESAEKWVNAKCPKCKGKARRETDTMDTFVNSSWYFLRYTDSKNKRKIFDSAKANYWAPVDNYIGGPEHITMHLIYVRFYTKFLKSLGLIKFDEPALKYFTQGVVLGQDGNRMSKSKGNVVEPLNTIKKYGADALRFYIVSVANPETGFSWDEKGIESSFKFMKKVVNYFEKTGIVKNADARTESKLNKTIKEVTDDIQNFEYNLAIIKIRELFESLPKKTSKEVLESFLKLINPFCPHISEELWEKIGNKNFVSLSDWPKVDEKKINEKFEKEDFAKDKIVSDILNIIKILEDRKEKREKVFVYVLPKELRLYHKQEISKRVGKEVKVFSVADKNKYDPTNKSKNAKPGKPGIYLE